MALFRHGLRLNFTILLSAHPTTSFGVLRGLARWYEGVIGLRRTGFTLTLWLHSVGWWSGTLLVSSGQETTGIIWLSWVAEGGELCGIVTWD